MLIDDRFHSNRKVLRMGLDGVGLYTRALSYIADYNTDGFVPETWARAAVGRKKRLLQHLVDVGAWEHVAPGDDVELVDRSANTWTHRVHEVGFFVLDYLKYNPSSREREQNRKAKASAGKKGAIKRWGDSNSHRNEIAGATSEPWLTDGRAMARARAPARAPSPSPTPEEPPAEDFALTAVRSETTSNGLPITNEHLTAKLLAAIGSDADDKTPQVIRALTKRLPDGAIAKVLESIETTKPKNRAAYAVGALRSEFAELAERR